MLQLCRIYDAVRAGKIDAADMALPNLIDDIILSMKKHGLLEQRVMHNCSQINLQSNEEAL